MCLGPVEQEPTRAMSEELAAVCLCRQQAERLLGVAAGKHGKVLVTVQGDGVITYSAAQEAVGHSRALGSSQARLLAPVQQLDNSFVAAVQNQGSAYGVLLMTPVTSQQPRPLLDAEQQLPLPSKLHSLHVLQPAGTHTGGRPGAGVAAVVLADGTVAAADFKQLRLQPAVNTSAAAAAAANGQQHRAAPHRLSTASNGELLAVAKQQQQQQQQQEILVTIDIYSTSSHNSTSTDDASLQQQQGPGLQLCHSCSILAPSPGSKLSGLSVSGSLLVAAWSCHSITAYHHNFLLQGAASQPGHAATLQLPSPLAAVLAAAAAAGGSGEQTPNERSSKRKQRTAAAAAAAGSPGPSWAAAALSDQHVLVLVVHNESGSIQVRYALLDSTYGSCLASGAFSAGSVAAADGAAACLQLLPLPQHPFAPVALVVAGSVWLLGLRLPKADLAGLVSHLGLGSTQAHAVAGAGAADGSQLLLTSRQQLNLAAIAAAVSSPASQVQQQQQVPCILQQLQQPAASASAAAGDAVVTSAVQQVQQVLDKQKRPVQELQSAVQALCTALEQQQQQQQGAEGLQPKQQRLSQQQQAATSVCVSQQLLAAAMSALAEAQEWSLIERLHGLVSLQSLTGCADLVPALAAAQQYSSMRQVLLAAQEIPAESVVKAMQQLLQQQQDGSSTQQQAAAQQIRAAAEAVVAQAEAAAAAEHGDAADQLVKSARAAAVAVDRFTSRELLLHVLLFVQVDGVEAQAALRTLPAAAVLRLLRYSIKWLHKYSREQVTAHSSDPLLVMPSKAQVLEWSKLLLDAQLTKLMMMPAAGPLLQQLQQLMQAEVVCTSKLVALKGVTDTWMTGAPLPAAAVAAHSQYVLELLDLRVTPAAGAATGGAAAVAGRKK